MLRFRQKPQIKSPWRASSARDASGEPLDFYAILAGAALGILYLTFAIVQPRFQVGDMLAFTPSAIPAGARTVTATAELDGGTWGRPGRACTLDSSVMAHPGGTLTVTAIKPEGIILSWTGPATAKGAQDCGRNAQLIVAGQDLQRLQMALTPGPKNPR